MLEPMNMTVSHIDSNLDLLPKKFGLFVHYCDILIRLAISFFLANFE